MIIRISTKTKWSLLTSTACIPWYTPTSDSHHHVTTDCATTASPLEHVPINHAAMIQVTVDCVHDHGRQSDALGDALLYIW